MCQYCAQNLHFIGCSVEVGGHLLVVVGFLCCGRRLGRRVVCLRFIAAGILLTIAIVAIVSTVLLYCDFELTCMDSLGYVLHAISFMTFT